MVVWLVFPDTRWYLLPYSGSGHVFYFEHTPRVLELSCWEQFGLVSIRDSRIFPTWTVLCAVMDTLLIVLQCCCMPGEHR